MWAYIQWKQVQSVHFFIYMSMEEKKLLQLANADDRIYKYLPLSGVGGWKENI